MRKLIVFLATVLFAGAAAIDGQACTLRQPLVLPGESLPQAYLRLERAAQEAAWNRAEFVALAQVRSSWLADGHVASQLVVIAPIKGAEAPRDVRFADPEVCGPGPRLEVGGYVLIYGFWTRGRIGPVNTRRLAVIRVLPLGDVIDPRVPAALRDTAKRLRASR